MKWHDQQFFKTDGNKTVIYLKIKPLANQETRFVMPRAELNKFGHAYTPKEKKDYYKKIKEEIRMLGGREVYEENVPLYVKIFLFVNRPNKPINDLVVTRPDVDAYSKPLLDVLSSAQLFKMGKDNCYYGVGVYPEDKAICKLYVEKQYIDPNPLFAENPTEESMLIVITKAIGRTLASYFHLNDL